MPTQGEVSIRFSVQDQETVRQALEKLGKDGQAALERFNAANSGKPSAGLEAMSVAADKLKGSILGLAYNVGPLGSVLLALGPAGTAVAATFGAMIGAFDTIKERSDAFRQYARDVKDAAEATGFTTTQIQALTDLLGRHGVSAEQAATGLQKFATEQVAARKGSGELYDELKRINPALAESFASARTPAAALDVLARAIGSVDTQTGILLGRLAAGRGSAGFVASLQEMAGSGGLGAVEQAAIKAGLAIDSSIIEKQGQAAVAAGQKAKQVEQNWNAAAANVHQAWRDFKKQIGFGDDWSLGVSVKVKAFTEDKSFGTLAADVAKAYVDGLIAAAERVPVLGPGLTLAKEFWKRAAPESGSSGGVRVPIYSDPNAGASGVPLPASRPRAANTESDRLRQAEALQRQIVTERERLGILGDVASAEDKIRLKTDEVSLALLKRQGISAAEGRLVVENYRNQVQAADIAIRTSLGVASADERRLNFEERLAILVREKKISEEQSATALAIYNKTLRETIENERVRASLLPNLTRMQLDAANLNKTLDQFGTSIANDVGIAFTQIVSGTQSASDGFRALEQAVLQSLARMVYQMTIARLVAQSLNSVLGFFGGGGGTGAASPQATGNPTGIGGLYASGGVFSGGRVTAFASGGVIDRPTLFPMANGMGLMGEAGPEAVMPLRKGRDGRLGVSTDGGGGRAPVVNVIIENNSGAEATAGAARANSSGGTDIQVMIKQAVKDGIGRGEFDGVMGARFGQRSGTVRR